MKSFKKLLYSSAFESAFNTLVPQLIPLAVFIAFIGFGGSLDLAVSLIAFSYFDRLLSVFSQAPDLVNKFNELMIALTRIQKFIDLPDIQKNIRGISEEYALEIKGSFSWGTKNAIENLKLKNIDLKVRKGEFLCIIGDVGSGKSSLLHSINGDMIFVPENLQATFDEAGT